MQNARDDETGDIVSPRRPVARPKVQTPKNPLKRTAMNEEQPDNLLAFDDTSRYQETLSTLRRNLKSVLPKKQNKNEFFEQVRLAILKAIDGNNIHDILTAATPLLKRSNAEKLKSVADIITRVQEAFDDLTVRKVVSAFVFQSKSLIATKWDYDDVDYAVIKQEHDLKFQEEMDRHNQQILDELERIERERAAFEQHLLEAEDEFEQVQKEDNKLEYPIKSTPLQHTPLFDLKILTKVLSPRSMKLITLLQQGKVSGRPDRNYVIDELCFAICMNYQDQSSQRLKAVYNQFTTDGIESNFHVEVFDILDNADPNDDVVPQYTDKNVKLDRVKKLNDLLTVFFPKKPKVLPREGRLFEYTPLRVAQIIEAMAIEAGKNPVMFFEESVLSKQGEHDPIHTEKDKIVVYFKTLARGEPKNPKSTYFTETEYCKLFTAFRDSVMTVAREFSQEEHRQYLNTYEQAVALNFLCERSIEAGRKEVDQTYVKTVVNDHDLLDLYTRVREAAEESEKDYVTVESFWSKLFGSTQKENPFAKRLASCLDDFITIPKLLKAWHEDDLTYQNIQRLRSNLKRAKHANHDLMQEKETKIRETMAKIEEVNHSIQRIDDSIRELSFSRSQNMSALNISVSEHQPSGAPVLPVQSAPREAANPHRLMKSDKATQLLKLNAALCKRRHTIIAAFYRMSLDAKFNAIRDDICFLFCANYADQSKAKTLQIIEQVRAAHPQIFVAFEQTNAGMAIAKVNSVLDITWDNVPPKSLTDPLRLAATLLQFYMPGKSSLFTTNANRAAYFFAEVSRLSGKASAEALIDKQIGFGNPTLVAMKSEILQIIVATNAHNEAASQQASASASAKK